MSSALSGTYQMANSIADKAEIPVSVIDSKGPTMSSGWQVLAVARTRDEGASMAEIDRLLVAGIRSNTDCRCGYATDPEQGKMIEFVNDQN